MPRDRETYPAIAGTGPATDGPFWRAVLEHRWRVRLREVTELSVAYHGAAASGPDGSGDAPGEGEARRLLHRAVAARRKLADTDDALGRLAAGRFGRCEQCGAAIPYALLRSAPEVRYCPRCATGDGAPALAGGPAAGESR
jgi:RNA polymerase-binding transcription factor DksA